MAEAGPAERARRNANSIAGTVVTGVWLTALIAGYEHWLALMLFGYIVVLPVVGMVFGEEGWSTAGEEWTAESDDDSAADDTSATDDSSTKDGGSATDDGDDALTTLRERYARGELTDEQFERKVERLLETDTLENAEDRRRDRERDRARERDRERELE